MNNSKLKLSLILLAIAVPISLATLMFNLNREQLSLGTSSKGILIQPVLDIGELGLIDQDGKPAYQTFEEMTEKVSPADYKARPWQLLYLGSETCEEVCQQRLYFLRQLHVRLGSDAARVQRVYVLTASVPAQVEGATLLYLQAEQADMRVVNADPVKLAQILARTVGDGADPQAEHYIYVMDPVGNIMLYFTPSNNAEEILKDITKLLKNSSLG